MHIASIGGYEFQKNRIRSNYLDCDERIKIKTTKQFDGKYALIAHARRFKLDCMHTKAYTHTPTHTHS